MIGQLSFTKRLKGQVMLKLYAVKFEEEGKIRWLQIDYTWTEKLSLFCLFENKDIITDMLIDAGKGELVTFFLNENITPSKRHPIKPRRLTENKD